MARGHIRARGKGTWAVVIELERGADGKRRQKWHTVRGTKRDAERTLARLLHTSDVGEYVAPQRLTVAQFLQRWFDDAASRRLAPASSSRYEEQIRLYLAPGLGLIRLTSLSSLQIQAFYSGLLDGDPKSGRKPLAPQSVRQVHNVLRQSLQQAIRWQMISRNPADGVELPRRPDATPSIFTQDELGQITAASAGQPIYLPLILAIATGMRRNEILGLRWSDVDLIAGRLAVRTALVQVGRHLELREPKSPSSRRPIDLPQFALLLLSRHREEQARLRDAAPSLYRDQGLVICRHDGSPAIPRVLNQRFAALLRQTGLPPRRFHDLRHTHATLLLQQGIHPKVVSERLGHSRVAITLDRYSHILPHLQKDAAERVDVALRDIVLSDGLQTVCKPEDTSPSDPPPGFSAGTN